MRRRLAIVLVCAATLMFSSFAESATARSSRPVAKRASALPTQRTFAAAFKFGNIGTVADASCANGSAVDISGSFVRQGRPSWILDSHTCVDGTRGAFAVTTGSGIVLSGGVTASGSGHRTDMVLTITSATRRYSGGHFDLTFDTSGAGPAPSVTGTLVFVDPTQRTFSGTATITTLHVGGSVHCAPGATFIDAAGTFARSGAADWSFALQTCTPSGIVGLGSFTVTSPTGIVITGSPHVQLVGTVFVLTLAVQQASREYTGGTLTITVDSAQGNKIGTVLGSLAVG